MRHELQGVLIRISIWFVRFQFRFIWFEFRVLGDDHRHRRYNWNLG